MQEWINFMKKISGYDAQTASEPSIRFNSKNQHFWYILIFWAQMCWFIEQLNLMLGWDVVCAMIFL